MNIKLSALFFFLILIIIFSCQNTPENKVEFAPSSALFSKVASAESGVGFANNITENEQKNYFNFEYIYNGAGVATGDLDNDGRPDIFFAGNEVSNKLYLNRGDFKFADVSKAVGIEGAGGWHNGVTMVDVNSDGWLDIYVCAGGWHKDPNKRKNKLYINSGKTNPLKFTEQAEAYGLAGSDYSLQSSFFDYDNDGDLDVYVTNHPIAFNLSLPDRLAKRKNPGEQVRDKLYRNEGNNTFKEVGKSAGIINYGHGLGIVTADVNGDGFTDVYIGNDYKEPDYLYVNNGDGTFTDKVKQMTGHVSFNTMGVDIADLNNDGFEDIFTTEMLPNDYKRSKTNMASMDVKTFNGMLALGLHHQYMHNTLQLNRGNGYFSEISQLTGMSKTDWSWTCLLSDFDNDGLRDVFIANGNKRDVFDKDYEARAATKARGQKGKLSLDDLYKIIPNTKLQNFIFKNKGNLSFENKSTDWGLIEKTLSMGAAIADFDNDGDLDLVMNNLDDEALVYKNNSTGNSYLKIKLTGAAGNLQGVGAKITLDFGDSRQFFEQKITRGYYSSSEPIVHFGLGEKTQIKKLTVEWKSGKTSALNNVSANQLLEIKESEAGNEKVKEQKQQPLFVDKTEELLTVPFKHQENVFDDYKNQILLPHKQSQNGPFIAVGDVNGDGREDFHIGGAHLQSGKLYLQNANGTFTPGNNKAFETDRAYEDSGNVFFDSDGDGDLDLYVVSGGFEFQAGTNPYQDRLYKNDGKGNFSNQSMNTLFQIGISGSCVVPNDFDNDGDIDLFVGGRVLPNYYPYPTESFLMRNEGGRFVNVTAEIAPDLQKPGMVTSAVWSDVNGDGADDLVVTGEWMRVEIFLNQNGTFRKATDEFGLGNSTGWWNKIIAADIDGDGDEDFVAGNIGRNHKFKATNDEPFHIYCNDFDKNGSYDVVLAKNYEGSQVPIRGRECSSQQMPFVAQKFPTYNAFANADIDDILGEGKKEALHYEANYFETAVLKNEGGKFVVEPLPREAQFSAVSGIVWSAENKELVLAGNLFNTEAETTRADASIGLLLKRNGNDFEVISGKQSGLRLPYDTKDLKAIKIGKKQAFLLASNNDFLRVIIPN